MTRSPPTLPRAFFSFVFVGTVLFMGLTVWLVSDRTRAFQNDALERAVDVRTRGAAQNFARALETDWRMLDYIGTQFADAEPRALRALLDAAVGNGDRISWAGLARLDGTILEASRGMLEGVDVSERPWFQRGLDGAYAGDVHGALLLNQLLGGSEDDPIRFIDLARPVADPAGDPFGVIGFHIDFAWAERFIAESAQDLEMDLYLVSRNGEVIIATDGTDPGQADLPSMRAAAIGVAGTNMETWPDGRAYHTATVPQVTRGDLPSFGWRMVGRVEPAAVTGPRGVILEILTGWLAALTAVVAVLAVIFARLFLAPFARFAQSAEEIADGLDTYPHESRRTAEQARLTYALARLQARHTE